MKFINTALLVFALLAAHCSAVPAQRRSPNEEPKVAAAASPSKATTLSTVPKATASSQPAAKAPPVLLSQATAELAGGGVPSGPPPATSFSPTAVQLFKVANFIENIESAFFAEALIALSKDPAFTNSSADGKSIANITKQISAQELVHIATVGGLLDLVNEPAVPPCADVFTVADTQDFIAKSNMVTSASIGVIITIQQALAISDPAVITPLSSILSVESQQDAFFRMSGSNTPTASPLNTAISFTFAYNIALTFVDPRSCPQLLPLPILPSLNLTSPVMGATAPATPPTSITFTASDVPQSGNLFVGWVNQANPVVYSTVTVQNGIGTAAIPTGLTGIAFAALTAQNTAMTVDGLTNATLAGPAPILMS